ncbi:unnamed protein product [Urochloa humidicola]
MYNTGGQDAELDEDVQGKHFAAAAGKTSCSGDVPPQAGLSCRVVPAVGFDVSKTASSITVIYTLKQEDVPATIESKKKSQAANPSLIETTNALDW